MLELRRPPCLALAVVLLAVGRGAGQDGRKNSDERAAIRSAIQALAHQVEDLQDDFVESLTDQKDRALYRQADDVLADLVQLEQALADGGSRAELSRKFGALDRRVQELLKAVQILGAKGRGLHRAAARVEAAGDQLYDTLSNGAGPAEPTPQDLERQARALANAARQLDRAARYALGGVPGREVLLLDVRGVAEAAEQFQKTAGGNADRGERRKEFAAVNQAWERAVRGVQKLSVREHVHLQRLAGRVDRLHARLFERLGLEGPRPRLILRT